MFTLGQLQRRNALPGRGQKVHSKEPLIKGNMGTLKNRPNPNCKILLAGRATKIPVLACLDAVGIAAIRANRLSMPTAILYVRPCGCLIGKPFQELVRANGDSAIVHCIAPLFINGILHHWARVGWRGENPTHAGWPPAQPGDPTVNLTRSGIPPWPCPRPAGRRRRPRWWRGWRPPLPGSPGGRKGVTGRLRGRRRQRGSAPGGRRFPPSVAPSKEGFGSVHAPVAFGEGKEQTSAEPFYAQFATGGGSRAIIVPTPAGRRLRLGGTACGFPSGPTGGSGRWRPRAGDQGPSPARPVKVRRQSGVEPAGPPWRMIRPEPECRRLGRGKPGEPSGRGPSPWGWRGRAGSPPWPFPARREAGSEHGNSLRENRNSHRWWLEMGRSQGGSRRARPNGRKRRSGGFWPVFRRTGKYRAARVSRWRSGSSRVGLWAVSKPASLSAKAFPPRVDSPKPRRCGGASGSRS